MRHPYSPTSGSGSVRSLLLSFKSSFLSLHARDALLPLSFPLLLAALLTPIALIIIPNHPSPNAPTTILCCAVCLLLLFGLLLRHSEPGYALSCESESSTADSAAPLVSPYQSAAINEEHPLKDPDTLSILHRWADQYPSLLSQRESADALDGDLSSLSLCSGAQDPQRKQRLQHIFDRMARAGKQGEEGKEELVFLGEELQSIMSPSSTCCFPPPPPPAGGWSMDHLPPPPSRPHFVTPSAHKHPAVAYDRGLQDEAETQAALNSSSSVGVSSSSKSGVVSMASIHAAERAQRKAKKAAKKAADEAALYETRRRDDEDGSGVHVSAASSSPSPHRDSALKLEAGANSATEGEEEDHEGVRVRTVMGVGPESHNMGSSSATNGSPASAAGAASAPNPFASADNFFRHDFQLNPIDKDERERLMAATALSAASGIGGAPLRPATDEFYYGNPRWHPNKCKDDLERFAFDSRGIRIEYCIECQAWRNLGTKHCQRCQLCCELHQAHPAMAGCCVGRGNMRFLLLSQLTAVLIAAIVAYLSAGVVWSQSPFSWSSWRIAVIDSLNESGSAVFTWNYALLLHAAILLCSIGWTFALTLYHAFTLFDLIKLGNYITLAEGGALRADAPANRMRMNQLQLLLYLDFDEVLRFLLFILFSPVALKANPYEHRVSMRQKARERRREWKAIREAHSAGRHVSGISANGSSSSSSSAPVAAEAAPSPSLSLSPHHSVDISS